MQKYEIPQNCPFSLPFPTVIAFHRVKKSSLIIGIVDRIKINSEQPLPFSESELSIPYFLQIVCMTYVCFVYFAAIAQVCTDLYTVMMWKGIQVPRGLSGRRRRRSGDENGNQGVADFRFINILQFFSIYYYYFFIIFFFYTFFTHEIYPHPHPHPGPTPTTHDLYPLPPTFSYTRFSGAAYPIHEYRVSQKFVPLITRDINFDRNYTSA